MKKLPVFQFVTSVLAGTAAAGTFYDSEPSGKTPIAPPPVVEPVAGSCASDFFDYDFVDLEYRFVDFDDDALDEANGISLALSKTLTECTFVTLGGIWEEVDAPAGEDLDFWSFSAGAGMIFPFSERVHLVAEGGLFYAFEDGGEDDEDSFGGYVGPTLRVGLTRALEVFAGTHFIVDEDTDQFEYSVGGLLRVTPSLGVKASWAWNDDEQTVGVGVRLAF